MINTNERRATYEAACKKLEDLKTRAADVKNQRDKLRANVARLEMQRTELLADEIAGAENAKEQAKNKTGLRKARERLEEAEEKIGLFDTPLEAAVMAVREKYSALESVTREVAKGELDAVLEELKAVATPLIAKALALYPAANHGYSGNAEALLKSLGLFCVKAGQPSVELPRMPLDARNWQPKPQPKQESRPVTPSLVSRAPTKEEIAAHNERNRRALESYERSHVINVQPTRYTGVEVNAQNGSAQTIEDWKRRHHAA